MAAEPKLIVNLTHGSVVCEKVLIADRPLRRLRGLLGRSSLALGEGMLLQPAPSIHTAFMRFPIDVAFMDGTLTVVKLVQQLQPWRAASAHRARAVLELADGELARRGIAVGDHLGVIEPGAEHDGVCKADFGKHAIGGTRVLVIGSDRRFRSVAAALLTRRGCIVTLGERAPNMAGLALRERAEVVVLEVRPSLTATAREVARLESLDPPVGVVVVGDQPDGGLSALPVRAKWDSFEDLYSAIQDARPDRRLRSSGAERQR